MYIKKQTDLSTGNFANVWRILSINILASGQQEILTALYADSNSQSTLSGRTIVLPSAQAILPPSYTNNSELFALAYNKVLEDDRFTGGELIAE